MGERYKQKGSLNVYEVNLLEADEKELSEIAKTRSLGLSAAEMVKIRDHFKKEDRNPTDVELEAFAQSWSEHCCYKTSRPILKKTVFNIEAPQNICVISEDAGVVDFDEEHAYVVALESHNHPSALDPYGGAATGIGGILRDVICMGAQPVALVDPLFFGTLSFPDDKLSEGTKHPQYLLKGVVQGIADYGNRVGIPTVSGMVFFDDSYVGNCLVNVGCIGIMRKDELIHSRAGGAGDIYILAGGKTGRDGIHGVTFASAELTEDSEEESRPAVQLGYAIMKEPLMHACLEANRKGLLTGMKDFGGGGLSCVSAEMAHSGGFGATVELDRVPLKEEGVSPWEIWVSESQERMMVSVLPGNVDNVLEIFDFWDVEATVVGKVDDSGRIKATFKGETVLDLELEFLIAGVVYERPYSIVECKDEVVEYEMPDLAEACFSVLGSANIASKESVIRRYDHEVRGSTVLKPMQGVVGFQSHGDAAVLKPVQDSFRGLALTCDVNPHLLLADPYWGAASAVDEVIRNLVAVGARAHSMADCLNFGNPEKPERLGDFKRACEGLRMVAGYFKVPFVSGNVSLYNESTLGPIAPTPTILGVGIIGDVRKAVSSDLKKKGSVLYLVGDTYNELKGSQYHRIIEQKTGNIPKVHLEKLEAKVEFLLRQMDAGRILACHDLSEGGLFTAACEMAFGGNTGIELDLCALGSSLRTDAKLFSESNGRWLIEVSEKDSKEFERFDEAVRIGKVTGTREIKILDDAVEFEFSLDELRTAWNKGVEEESG
ncbi:MAG: phosphoribosylformylglycinamidine synthase subunit PurL [Candidatus Altiarchaeota archaeon]